MAHDITVPLLYN